MGTNSVPISSDSYTNLSNLLDFYIKKEFKWRDIRIALFVSLLIAVLGFLLNLLSTDFNKNVFMVSFFAVFFIVLLIIVAGQFVNSYKNKAWLVACKLDIIDRKNHYGGNSNLVTDE